MDSDLELLQGRLKYHFENGALLTEALTHKSFSNESADTSIICNERLEFLGDAVLDLVISEQTFLGYPELPEGELTRIRAELVSEKNLSALARELDIGPCLRLGRGERRSGGDRKSSLLADSVEAIIGALFCDSDYATVRTVVSGLFAESIESAARREFDRDYKTSLQELSQKVYREPPQYRLLQTTGPDHQRLYEVEVLLAGEPVGRGNGRSKKVAEQQAAQIALERLQGGE